LLKPDSVGGSHIHAISGSGAKAALGIRRSASAPTLRARQVKAGSRRQLHATMPIIEEAAPLGAHAVSSTASSAPREAAPREAAPREAASRELTQGVSTVRKRTLPPKGLSPHVLEHYTAWGTGGGRINMKRLDLSSKSSSQEQIGTASAAAQPRVMQSREQQAQQSQEWQTLQSSDLQSMKSSNDYSSKSLKVYRQRQCYRQSQVPKVAPTQGKSSLSRSSSKGKLPTSSSKPTSGLLTGSAGPLAASVSMVSLPRTKRRPFSVPKFDSSNIDHWTTSKTQGELFESYAPMA